MAEIETDFEFTRQYHLDRLEQHFGHLDKPELLRAIKLTRSACKNRLAVGKMFTILEEEMLVVPADTPMLKELMLEQVDVLTWNYQLNQDEWDNLLDQPGVST